MVSNSSLQIREVKTFLIEGVGTGGDYHNVGCSVTSTESILAEQGRSREAIGS